MFLKKLNGYLLAIVSGLVLLAGTMLLALQWDNTGSFSLYGRKMNVNMTTALFSAVIAGWLTPKVFRLMLKGLRKIRKVRKEYKKL
jgi:uncharacterized membrane protein YdcZ (DUF606 family)